MSELDQTRDIGAPAQSGAPMEGIVEKLFKFLSMIALVIMLAVIAIDIFTRSVLNFSYEISDEISAYMLVALAFLSLSVCHVHGSFHQVEAFQERLSERGRLISRLLFELGMLTVAGLLLWQYVRLEMFSWRFGEKAPTFLETPLWLPRLLMVAGVAALCWSLCRTILRHAGRLRNFTPADAGRPDGR